MKAWRLTRHAEDALLGIASWTIDNFGDRQALLYEDELIRRCEAVAAGTALSQSCAILAENLSDEELRFTRAGEHFIVYYDNGEIVVILDFLHARSNLPEKIRALTEGGKRPGED